jgi:hypothetical protein
MEEGGARQGSPLLDPAVAGVPVIGRKCGNGCPE